MVVVYTRDWWPTRWIGLYTGGFFIGLAYTWDWDWHWRTCICLYKGWSIYRIGLHLGLACRRDWPTYETGLYTLACIRVDLYVGSYARDRTIHTRRAIERLMRGIGPHRGLIAHTLD